MMWHCISKPMGGAFGKITTLESSGVVATLGADLSSMKISWGQGYATEAANKIVSYAFGELKFKRLVASMQWTKKTLRRASYVSDWIFGFKVEKKNRR